MNRLVLLVSAIVLAGCAAGAPQPTPADFPIHARDQVFVLDYRIDKQPDRVEAVGLITARTTQTFRFANLNFFGVDANGRVVSRASYVVNGTWGGPQSFSLMIKPTGEEATYQLRVGNYSLGLGGM